MPRRSLPELWKSEFTGYTLDKFRQDSLAGLTVAAVALPLALAFGVASGATAAAGMVTAILAGVIIGALSGAPYQISGPTGAMSAVLILLAQKYGMFVLAPVMSHVPLAALAGVLIVTAWRMNEWEAIRYIFGRRFKTAMITFGMRHTGSTLMLAGAHDGVQRMLGRGGLLEAIGAQNVFWSADQAIVAAEQRGCAHCRAEQEQRLKA